MLKEFLHRFYLGLIAIRVRIVNSIHGFLEKIREEREAKVGH